MCMLNFVFLNKGWHTLFVLCHIILPLYKYFCTLEQNNHVYAVRGVIK